MMTKTGWTVMADVWVGQKVTGTMSRFGAQVNSMEREGKLKGEGQVWGFSKY